MATLDQRGAAWRFATTVSLNDAYLDRLVIDRSIGRLTLSLITGDLQVGYWLTELDYTGARIVTGEADLRLALRVRPSEILYDEFGGAPWPASHAFLLAIDGEDSLVSTREFKIAFDQFEFSQVRLAQRSLTTNDDQSNWE